MLAFLILLIAALGIAPVYAQPKNLVTVQPIPTTLTVGELGQLELAVVVPPGFHVYKDMLEVEILDAAQLNLGAPDLPPGIFKPDPASPDQDREQYDLDAVIQIPATASTPGAFSPTLAVTFQACKDTICFLPRTEELVVPVAVEQAALVNTAGGSDHSAAPVLEVDFSGLPEGAEVRSMDGDKPHPVIARMLADKDMVTGGGQLRVGVHLEHAPGWHTYWRSPGDVGKPLEIDWALPEGIEADEPVFAIPVRYELEGLVSYGYDAENLLFTTLTIPEDIAQGEHTIKASARWLVCEIQCIPGGAELSLPITVGPADTPSRFAPLFDHYENQHPTDTDAITNVTIEAALSVEAVGPEQPFQATILVTPAAGAVLEIEQTEGTWPAFTPIADGNFMITESVVQQTEAGAVLVTVVGETYELFEGDPLPEEDILGGLLQLTVDGKSLATEVVFPVPWVAAAEVVGEPATTDPATAADPAVTEPAAPLGTSQSYLGALGLAFLGGIILNIMPCVLPVLTLKLYSLVGQQDASARERQAAGLAYTGGIVASFLLLAVGVLLLKEFSGVGVGWGFQFQYPGYVAALATVVFVFGLSLFGVFEIPALGANQAAEASDKEGLGGYFLTGVFATLLATPCSAPFLGTGMGFAFSLPAAGILLFFAVAGLGLAFPFLVIAFVPAFMRFMPRPGAWMETFKQALGFTLIATTVWLVDVLGAQLGRDGMTGFLAFLTVVGLASWIFGRWGGPIHSGKQQLTTLLVAIVLSALGGWMFLSLEPAAGEAHASTTVQGAIDPVALWGEQPCDLEDIPWGHFTEEAVSAQAGKPVFIDFTAEWCLTCKVNEKTILNTCTTKKNMAQAGVVPLKADWTNRDETITTWLQRYGKAGVPFYLVIPADPSQPPIPLPEVITPDIVNQALRQAQG